MAKRSIRWWQDYDLIHELSKLGLDNNEMETICELFSSWLEKEAIWYEEYSKKDIPNTKIKQLSREYANNVRSTISAFKRQILVRLSSSSQFNGQNKAGNGNGRK